jgi:hypothetical protein
MKGDKPTERKPIAFSKWTPVQRDSGISYSYVFKGRKKPAFGDRWMRAKSRIAATAIHTGVEEFTVYGGVGAHRWVRTVTCTEAEAIEFFEQAIANGAFTLKGRYRAALAGRKRRLDKEDT